ncbi:Cell division integral membrane protein, YggT and half-length relatives [hydrothermal vent metagenome]|uniref:Cell division integral membrane protein, YggT and half-length relatives n=1 Tax=hydrothermal vent metagenome TaxID=652676 RepID=A0A3B0TES1_9ZZZZ
MRAILEVVILLLDLYWWVLLAMIVLSWLISFNVINTANQFVATVHRVVTSLTEPLLKPIRRVVPAVGGLDLSPIILFVGLFFVRRVIILYIYPNVF